MRRCEQLAGKLGAGTAPLSSKLTEAQYTAYRADFQASRFTDLRTAGTALLDLYIAGAGPKPLDGTKVIAASVELGRVCASRQQS